MNVCIRNTYFFKFLLSFGFFLFQLSLNAQTTKTLYLRRRADSTAYFRSTHLIVDNRSYKLLIWGNGQEVNDDNHARRYVNFRDDSTLQLTSFDIEQNTFSIRLKDNNHCLSFLITNDSASQVEYNEMPCIKLSLDGQLISDLPNMRVKDFFSGKLFSLDSLTRNTKTAIPILIHFVNIYENNQVYPYLNQFKKMHLKHILFFNPQFSKDEVKSFIDRNYYEDRVYLAGNDSFGNYFNQSGYPFSILFVKNKLPQYFEWGGLEEVYDYILKHPGILN